MDDIAYRDKQQTEFRAYEARCKCCGVCCGAKGDDPCSKLRQRADGTYYCATYESRFGVQRSVSGREFTCVMIRDVIAFGVRYEGCGYNE